MIRVTAVLFFVLYSLHSQAQDLYVGALLNSAQCYRTTNSSDADEYEEKMHSINYGLQVVVGMNEKWSFVSGVNYLQQGYGRNPMLWVYNKYVYSTEYRMHFLELPTVVQYRVLQFGRFTLHASAGLTHQFLFKEDHVPYEIWEMPWYLVPQPPDQPFPETETVGYSDLKDSGYRMYNLALYGELEFQYRIGRYHFGVAPTIRYSLFPTVREGTDTPHHTDEHLYALGLQVRMLYWQSRRQ